VRQKFDEKEHGNKLYGHDSKIGGRVLSNLLSSVMLSNLINFSMKRQIEDNIEPTVSVHTSEAAQ
jgi:hypothetical protein